jgi:hypothetical protein
MFSKVYNNLCRKGCQLKENWYPGSNVHRHHIIPKHAGGLDEESNYTYLTVREHIIAHFLLWKMHKNTNDLRAMYMLGANLSSQQRKLIGEWCRDNNIGFFKYKEERKKWSKKGAQTQMKNKIGIHDPQNFKKNASIGGKFGSRSQIIQGIAIFNKEKRAKYASLGGKSLKGMICVTNGKHRTRIKPEKLNEYLSKGYKKGFTLFS